MGTRRIGSSGATGRHIIALRSTRRKIEACKSRAAPGFDALFHLGFRQRPSAERDRVLTWTNFKSAKNTRYSRPVIGSGGSAQYARRGRRGTGTRRQTGARTSPAERSKTILRSAARRRPTLAGARSGVPGRRSRPAREVPAPGDGFFPPSPRLSGSSFQGNGERTAPGSRKPQPPMLVSSSAAASQRTV